MSTRDPPPFRCMALFASPFHCDSATWPFDHLRSKRRKGVRLRQRTSHGKLISQPARLKSGGVKAQRCGQPQRGQIATYDRGKSREVFPKGPRRQIGSRIRCDSITESSIRSTNPGPHDSIARQRGRFIRRTVESTVSMRTTAFTRRRG